MGLDIHPLCTALIRKRVYTGLACGRTAGFRECGLGSSVLSLSEGVVRHSD